MVWVKRNEKKISAALKMPKVKKKKKNNTQHFNNVNQEII